MATVKFKDSTLTLLGNEVKVGQAAPDFKVQKSADMSDYTLASGAGKTRIIATVPSLDTPGIPRKVALRGVDRFPGGASGRHVVSGSVTPTGARAW